MKSTKLYWIAAPLLCLGTVILYRSAVAEELPHASANAETSMTRGFKESSLAVLRRAGGANRQAVADTLLEPVCAAPCESASRADTGKALQASHSNWALEVTGDGSAARFQDREVQKRARSIAVTNATATKQQSNKWVNAGRSFIASRLASVIVLGPDEQLVPLRTDYRVEGGYNALTHKTTRSVVANRVVFGRTIHGVPVVGGGSTVVVTFANDGALESYQYDWPQYESSGTRNLANVDVLLQRVQKVVGARTPGVAASSSAQSPIRKNPDGVELANNTTLLKMECGYFDPGAGARPDGGPVQPGCVYHAVRKNENGTRSGYAGAVPAASEIESDPQWPESLILK